MSHQHNEKAVQKRYRSFLAFYEQNGSIYDTLRHHAEIYEQMKASRDHYQTEALEFALAARKLQRECNKLKKQIASLEKGTFTSDPASYV